MGNGHGRDLVQAESFVFPGQDFAGQVDLLVNELVFSVRVVGSCLQTLDGFPAFKFSTKSGCCKSCLDQLTFKNSKVA